VAKKTGRLDLSTQQMPAVEPTEESEMSSDIDRNSPLGSPKSQFVNQWREPKAPKASEMKIVPSSTSTVEYYLEEIPSGAFAISGLTEIWLCNNPLRSLPPSLANFHALQVLSLANVGLQIVPLEVSGLISLRRLYLQKNQISSLPDELSALTLLTDFNISLNLLSGDLPAVILQFKHLAYLNLSNNNITTIPEDMTQLSSLSLLDITETTLNSFPENICRRMPHLLVVGRQQQRQQQKLQVEQSEKKEDEKKKKRREGWSGDSGVITKEDEQELLGFLRHRAAVSVAAKNTKSATESSNKTKK
jgi:Leucine-rich repeat (LRR) protein